MATSWWSVIFFLLLTQSHKINSLNNREKAHKAAQSECGGSLQSAHPLPMNLLISLRLSPDWLIPLAWVLVSPCYILSKPNITKYFFFPSWCLTSPIKEHLCTSIHSESPVDRHTRAHTCIDTACQRGMSFHMNKKMLHLQDIKVDLIWTNQGPVCRNLGHFPELLFPGRRDADLSIEAPLSCCSRKYASY